MVLAALVRRRLGTGSAGGTKSARKCVKTLARGTLEIGVAQGRGEGPKSTCTAGRGWNLGCGMVFRAKGPK